MLNTCTHDHVWGGLQPFSQKSRTPTVAKEFQIGLYDPAEAYLELFCNSWSAGFLGERLYTQECVFRIEKKANVLRPHLSSTARRSSSLFSAVDPLLSCAPLLSA